jgi:hypothetical protein
VSKYSQVFARIFFSTTSSLKFSLIKYHNSHPSHRLWM